MSIDFTTLFHPSTAVKLIIPLELRVTVLKRSVFTHDIGTSSSAQYPMLCVPLTGSCGEPISPPSIVEMS